MFIGVGVLIHWTSQLALLQVAWERSPCQHGIWYNPEKFFKTEMPVGTVCYIERLTKSNIMKRQ